jgi:hypothetical protein
VYLLRLFALTVYEILSELNFYVRVSTYEKRVTGMQPLLIVRSVTQDCVTEDRSEVLANSRKDNTVMYRGFSSAL